MSEELWSAVDLYITEKLVRSDPALTAAIDLCEEKGLPPISVAPNQGKFLHMLAQIQGAQRILEIGTLGGYSTIWLARALPTTGRLVTLEIDPGHAEIARENIARAGLSGVVEVRVGRALDLLPALLAERQGAFDFIFIDADKANIPEYLAWSLKLSRPGTLIIVDNVVREGEVANPASTDASVRGVRRFMDLVAADKRLEATAIQTVGGKGYDGFALVRVK